MKILPGGLNWRGRFNLIIWCIFVRSVHRVSEALQTLFNNFSDELLFKLWRVISQF